MTTPLFPENNGRIHMKQGVVGDCYLLAALDCIFTAGEDGYELVKSLFTDVGDGVEVRFKRTDQSTHLQVNKIRGKYGYYYDQARNEDVFFLDRARLNEIDRSRDGVETNSLAVKILERLSPYYFTAEWDDSAPREHQGLPRSASVSAHSLDDRFDASSTTFVGKLLGIYAHDLHEAGDVDKIIKLKRMFPEQPVYISIDYGKRDAYGQIHTRHGLRLDKIICDRDNPGGFKFILVNPWNTEAPGEEYSLNEIKHRCCRFSFFRTNQEHYETMCGVLNLPDELLAVLRQIRRLGVTLSVQDLDYYFMLYKHKHDFIALFNSFSATDKQLLVQYTSIAKRDMGCLPPEALVRCFDTKINEIQLLSRERAIAEAHAYIATCIQRINAFPVGFSAIYSSRAVDVCSRRLILQLQQMIQTDDRLATAENTLGLAVSVHLPGILEALSNRTQEIDVVAEQLRICIERADRIVDGCIRQIEDFPVSFETARSNEMVRQQRRTLLVALDRMVDTHPQLAEALSTLGYPGRRSPKIEEAIRIKSHTIDRRAQDAKNKIISTMQAVRFLEQIDFFTHLSQVAANAEELQMIAGADSQYKCSAGLAMRLHTTLEAIKNDFISSVRSKTESLRVFKLSSLQAIREISPALNELLDWRKTLADLVRVLSAISTVRLAQPPNGRFGLFPPIVGLNEEIHVERRSWPDTRI